VTATAQLHHVQGHDQPAKRVGRFGHVERLSARSATGNQFGLTEPRGGLSGRRGLRQVSNQPQQFGGLERLRQVAVRAGGLGLGNVYGQGIGGEHDDDRPALHRGNSQAQQTAVDTPELGGSASTVGDTSCYRKGWRANRRYRKIVSNDRRTGQRLTARLGGVLSV